jgi:hypothetical protein
MRFFVQILPGAKIHAGGNRATGRKPGRPKNWVNM